MVAFGASHRVKVDDQIKHGRPETVQEVRAHVNHVQALAYAKEPEALADGVMLLKRERNALLNDKQMLLVNKRRLEAVLAKLLGMGGLDWDDEEGRGGPNVKVNPFKAKMLKVLDDSRALDNKLSAPLGATAGLTLAEAEALVTELKEKLAKLQAERDHLVGRLEGELQYRRTQAAAVTSGLQKQLAELQEENERLRRKAAELEGHLEFQVGELSNKVAALTQQLTEANEKLSCDTGTMAEQIEELKKALAAALELQAQQAAKIGELEHLLVQRDNTISEYTAAQKAEEATAKAAAEMMEAFAGEAHSAAVAASADAAYFRWMQETAAAELFAQLTDARANAVEEAAAAAADVAGGAAAMEAFASYERREFEAARERAKELEKKVAELMKMLKEGQSNEEKKISETTAKLAEAQKMADDLRAQMEEAVSAERSKTKAAEDKLADLSRKLGEMESALRTKTQRVEELEQQVMGLDRDMKDLKALMNKKKGMCG